MQLPGVGEAVLRRFICDLNVALAMCETIISTTGSVKSDSQHNGSATGRPVRTRKASFFGHILYTDTKMIHVPHRHLSVFIYMKLIS